MRKMKVLLIVANFIPEIGSAAHIYFDLAKAFVHRGHDVDVITSYPRKFYLNKNDINKNFLLNEVIEGILVHRCKHNAIRDNIIMRGMEHFLLPYYYFRAFQRLNRTFDVCLIYIPPLPLYYFARAIKRFYGIPSVLNYQDFYPQELTDVGILKNGLLIRFMEYMERQSYKNADFITVLSEGGIEYVTRRGGDPSKIEHIYNGYILDSTGSSKKRDFKKKERIEDKILISYAGILSLSQGLDNILNVAKELKGHKDLIFYLVGDGIIRDHLVQRIKTEDISNVKLLPLQPRDEYFNIINSSDISLVSLDERMKAPCIPGKILNLMAMNQPLIAIVPNDSEAAKVVRRSKSGIVVKPGDVDGLSQAIINLSANAEALRKMGEYGQIFVRNNMNSNEIVQRYERIFEAMQDAII